MTPTLGLQIAAGVLLVALFVVLWRLQKLGDANHGRLDQWHHGYAFVLAFIPWWPVQVLGLYVGGDDLYQHLRQLRTPFYRSPLHRLAHKLGVI